VDRLASLAYIHGVWILFEIHRAWIGWPYWHKSMARGLAGPTGLNPRLCGFDQKSTGHGLTGLADLNPWVSGFDPKSMPCGLAGITGTNPQGMDWLALLTQIHSSVDCIQNPQGMGWLASLA
jgi:hypothetical protein